MRKTKLKTAAKTTKMARGWINDQAQPKMLER
jgi:hypothetical protein